MNLRKLALKHKDTIELQKKGQGTEWQTQEDRGCTQKTVSPPPRKKKKNMGDHEKQHDRSFVTNDKLASANECNTLLYQV